MIIYSIVTELTQYGMPKGGLNPIPFPLVYFHEKEDAEKELDNLIRSKRQYPNSKFYIEPILVL